MTQAGEISLPGQEELSRSNIDRSHPGDPTDKSFPETSPLIRRTKKRPNVLASQTCNIESVCDAGGDTSSSLDESREKIVRKQPKNKRGRQFIESEAELSGDNDSGDEAEDSQRYQTVFARNPGAVAAPTAALHFDEGVLADLQARGIERASVTLHVGAGTFQPVKTENLAEHQMHSEWYEVPLATLAALERCRQRGGRVVAVGTTTVRTLESWAQSGKTTGDTNIFITPGFTFKVVDVLITNFHLPKSTLMMLVSAFAGYAHIMGLYRHAIAQRYRFFSYGDAMLLERAKAAN